jgi:hypothetical protein
MEKLVKPEKAVLKDAGRVMCSLFALLKSTAVPKQYGQNPFVTE